MKKGIHYWALPTEMTLSEKFAFARNCGFDGVELAILKEGEFSECLSNSELRNIRNMADAEGIALPSLTNTLSWTCSFSSERKEIRDRAELVLRREIEIAGEMGIAAVLALPGFVSMGFNVNELHPATDTSDITSYHPSLEVIRYDRAYERGVEAFRRIADYAKSSGVTVCIENIWSNFLLSPLEMCRFIDDIGSGYVRAYLDVGNVRPFGIPAHWIEILGERIDRIHLKDYVDGEKVSLDRFTDLFEGDIDFRSVANAISYIGFDGWMTAELNVDTSDQERVARKASTDMDAILEMIKENKKQGGTRFG